MRSPGAGGSDASGLFCWLWTTRDSLWILVWGRGEFGEVEAGDLEAVEDDAAATSVEVVGGDALHDDVDRLLDSGAVYRQRDFEGGAAAAAVVSYRGWDGSAGGMVEVAEVLLAQAGAAAVAAVGEDVAALVAVGGVVHGVDPLPRGFLLKFFE